MCNVDAKAVVREPQKSLYRRFPTARPPHCFMPFFGVMIQRDTNGKSAAVLKTYDGKPVSHLHHGFHSIRQDHRLEAAF